MVTNFKDMTDRRILDLMLDLTDPVNKARQQLSWGSARLDRISHTLSPMEMRREEFRIVQLIAKELGVEI